MCAPIEESTPFPPANEALSPGVPPVPPAPTVIVVSFVSTVTLVPPGKEVL